MAFDPNKVIKPILFDNLDAIFDERGSAFLSLRRVQWCEVGVEPDREKSKLEIRKWRITAEGERADKGVAFLTEDGPHELAKTLVNLGYGDTKDLLLELKKRDNFKESVEHLFDKEEECSDGEYFDMRTIMLTEEEDNDTEDE